MWQAVPTTAKGSGGFLASPPRSRANSRAAVLLCRATADSVNKSRHEHAAAMFDGGPSSVSGIGAHDAPETNCQAGDTVFTIGHSTRTLAEFIALLRQVDVRLLVDVRSIPRSRAMPQFNGDSLPDSLAADGISYRQLRALGGLRHHRKDAPPSLNLYWRVVAFRDYADYAETAEFRAGLDALRALANDDRCAIMCAEAVWWRCHRRIITDYLWAGGTRVEHIMGPGQVVPATLTPGVRIMADGRLRYPAAEDAETTTSRD
jgi:hypothetical protein